MNRIERFETAGRALAECRAFNREERVIIVEGLRDKEALIQLGFTGDVEKVNRGWTLEKFIAYIFENYNSEPIILMDWDRTGGRLQKKLMDSLSSLDLKPSDQCRKILSKSLRPETLCVEDINTFADELLPIINFHDPQEDELPFL
ncbi:MAG: hypothetical protein QGI21_03690 [Candidatus Poseidoniaceae archaeon]|nr:hypothetical protein [Candidatus Poseidoniaceae archaeon]